MGRERALKVVIVLVGLLFLAAIYPVTSALRSGDVSGYPDAMMLSLYFTLGIFLLIAARNPSGHRSLIAFTAWSGFAHGTVMAVEAWRTASERGDLWGTLILFVIGVALLVLTPRKRSGQQASALDVAGA